MDLQGRLILLILHIHIVITAVICGNELTSSTEPSNWERAILTTSSFVEKVFYFFLCGWRLFGWFLFWRFYFFLSSRLDDL